MVGGPDTVLVTVTGTLAEVAMLPDVSVATAVSVWLPFAAVAVFQLML